MAHWKERSKVGLEDFAGTAWPGSSLVHSAFQHFQYGRVAAAKPALSENKRMEAASVTITDAELEQLLSGGSRWTA